MVQCSPVYDNLIRKQLTLWPMKNCFALAAGVENLKTDKLKHYSWAQQITFNVFLYTTISAVHGTIQKQSLNYY